MARMKARMKAKMETRKHAATTTAAVLLVSAGVLYAQDAYQQSQELSASVPAESDSFGSAVALSGGDAAVATFLSETVFAYERDGSGRLAPFDTLTAPEPGAFGQSLSIGGDWLIVGAPATDITDFNQGVVYVYERSLSGWIDRGRVTSSDVQQLDNFGTDVDLTDDGSFFIAGAKFDDDAGTSSGGAYIFERSGRFFFEAQKLVPSTLELGDQLGRAVAIDGDLAVVGAPFATRRSDRIFEGRAWVYRREGSRWVEAAELSVDIPGRDLYYGVSVDVQDGWIAVGTAKARAFIYRPEGDGWVQEAEVRPSSGGSAQFGTQVHLDLSAASAGEGVRLIVGDQTATFDGLINRGAVYVFERELGPGGEPLWPLAQRIDLDSPIAGDRLGLGLAASEGRVLAGARARGVDGVSGAGSAFVFEAGEAGCRADFDGDGELTIFDFLAFQTAFDAGDLRADFDGDGSLTIFDFLAFQTAFDAGCE
ncbi:MAG: GC-type dockerin domain-anchored protein [Phycisphaerales bacterium]